MFIATPLVQGYEWGKFIVLRQTRHEIHLKLALCHGAACCRHGGSCPGTRCQDAIARG
ncbi:hypothetical protein CHELA40_11989 [Chelatococcus asaccharovorans]|nr:hypothetical protein CHELA40_11989 [Chelatococcus asaccharovorans]CAH1683667.1 hypothetical protein CHELA17_63614 [Chelatococcus asaccharovorans]